MKHVVFFLSLLVVVLCSSCEKEELSLEQRMLGDWNVDEKKRTELENGELLLEHSSDPEYFFSFQKERVFLIMRESTGEIFEPNNIWLPLTNDIITFNRLVDGSPTYMCKVEEIENNRCFLVFEYNSSLPPTERTIIVKYALSRRK